MQSIKIGLKIINFSFEAFIPYPFVLFWIFDTFSDSKSTQIYRNTFLHCETRFRKKLPSEIWLDRFLCQINSKHSSWIFRWNFRVSCPPVSFNQSEFDSVPVSYYTVYARLCYFTHLDMERKQNESITIGTNLRITRISMIRKFRVLQFFHKQIREMCDALNTVSHSFLRFISILLLIFFFKFQ